MAVPVICLQGDHLIDAASIINGSIEAGKAAHVGPRDQVVGDAPLLGALVAGHQQHPGFLLKRLQLFSHLRSL